MDLYHRSVAAQPARARRRGGQAITTLRVEAWVTRPLRAEPSVDLGLCSPGRRVHRTLTVSLTRPLAEAGLDVRLDGVEGRAVVQRPFIEGRALVDLDLELPVRAGPLQAAIRLRSPPSPEGYVLDVPLRGEVVRVAPSAPEAPAVSETPERSETPAVPPPTRSP